MKNVNYRSSHNIWVRMHILVLIMGMLLGVTSCGGKNLTKRKTGTQGKIIIVTTFLPVYDMAVNVGGDRVLVKNLLPPGASPHAYEPTPEDLISVEDLEIIFKLGLGIDDWIEKTVAGEGKKGKVVMISKNIKVIPFLKSDSKHANGHNHNEKHSKGNGMDPHIWMDPIRMKEMAGNVRDTYILIRPEYEKEFNKNYLEYAKKP